MESRSIFRHHLFKNAGPYLFGFSLLIISCLLQLIVPMLLGDFTDRLEQNLLDYIDTIMFAIGITAAGLGIAFFRSTSRIYMFKLSRTLEMRVRGRLFSHWERMSAKYFNNQRIGDLMAHAISDVGVIREVTMQGIFQSFEALVLISITVAAMMAFVNPLLTLATILPLPLLSILAYRFNKRIKKQSAEVQEAIGGLTSRVQEFTSGIRVVKAFVQEKEECDLFSEDNRYAVRKNLDFVRSNSLFSSLSAGIVGFSFLVSVVAGGLMVLQAKITLGEFVAFNTYLSLLMAPIENLGKVVNLMQRGKASEERLLQILNTPPEIGDDSTVDPSIVQLDGRIEIRDLSFAYTNESTHALKNINLTVPQGTSLAIVGKVGSGKSTLVHLLVRLYDPPRGMIFIDHHDIRDIPLRTLRSHVGIVPQDQFLFSTTIRENISFDPRPYSDEQVEDAAKVAQVYDNITEFPQSFNTTLGERGVSLSGGQRQRIGIARAIIKHPSVLIFDDSLSAVDTETEDRILGGLNEMMQDRTTIIIGHRISSVQTADQIVVLQEGEIAEMGNHESLLERNGLYAEMYRKQLLDDHDDTLAGDEGQPGPAIPLWKGGASG